MFCLVFWFDADCTKTTVKLRACWEIFWCCMRWCHGSKALWVRTNMAAEGEHMVLEKRYSSRGPRGTHSSCALFVLSLCILLKCFSFMDIGDTLLNILFYSARFCLCVWNCLTTDTNVRDFNEGVLCFCNFMFLLVAVFTLSTGEQETV